MSDQTSENAAAGSIREGRAWVVDRLTDIDKKTRSFLTEHPIVALACAVGVGFVAARLLSARGSQRRR